MSTGSAGNRAWTCWALASLLLAGGVFAQEGQDESGDSRLFRKPVSSLRISAEQFGPAWTLRAGFVLDSFEGVDEIADAELRDIAKWIRDRMTPEGVTACADYTYFVAKRIITVRVFVFDSDEACMKWWQKKYGYDGWEKHYEAVAKADHPTLTSKQIPKRITRVGNIWLTCGQDEGDQHIQAVLDRYVARIIEARKSAKAKAAGDDKP